MNNCHKLCSPTIQHLPTQCFIIVTKKYVDPLRPTTIGGLRFLAMLHFIMYDISKTVSCHTGGSSGGGGLRGLQPPLNFQKKTVGHPRGRCDSFTRMAVVIDLVVTSSHSAWLCALNCTVAV